MGGRAPVKVSMQTAVGPLIVEGTEAAVTHVYFDGGNAYGMVPDAEPCMSGASGAAPAPVREAVRQLEQYFRGERRTFDFPMHVEGTSFQRQVWSYLQTIPLGETRTYGEVAAAVGRPKGARAVGGAVGRNPISIAVPCHRVVAADGKGGGYGGGMAAKRFLLALEGVVLP